MRNRILLIAGLAFSLQSYSQIQNGGFESWSDTLYSPLYNLPATNPWRSTPDNWYHATTLGVCRVEDQYSGNYAALLYTWYNYVSSELSYIQRNPGTPESLTGYYRYYLGGADYSDAQRYVRVTVWGSEGDTTGEGYFQFDTTSVYTLFNCPVTYFTSDQPDSILIKFFTNGIGSPDMVNGFLFIDDVEFKYSNIDIEESDSVYQPLKVYPVPATDRLYVDGLNGTASHYLIYDSFDRPVDAGKILEKTLMIDVMNLPSGRYQMVIHSATGINTIPFLKE